jgi:hypothetical protein
MMPTIKDRNGAPPSFALWRRVGLSRGLPQPKAESRKPTAESGQPKIAVPHPRRPPLATRVGLFVSG